MGDTFEVLGETYRLVDVRLMTLGDIKTLYLQEGCESPEEFEALWRGLHRGSFIQHRTYFVHWFAHVARTEGSGH